MYVSIDLSLRSTGLVVLDKDKHLVDFRIISNVEDGEKLIIKNSDDIISFIQRHTPTKISIEGLAFLALSGMKDVIYGNYWYLRCRLHLTFPDVCVNIIPVTQWRKSIISKERARKLKSTKDKAWAKKESVAKLPVDIREKFESYIKENKFKKVSIYDLADAYHLCVWSIGE